MPVLYAIQFFLEFRCMHLTEEQEEIIRNCGKLNYTVVQTARVLQLDAIEKANFLIAFNDETSQVRELYEEGKAKGEYEVEVAAQEALSGGDADAITFLNKQRHFNRMEDMKSELFGIPKK